ncbi:hypothetical protein D3C81_2169830 [compost metagenome]
MGHDAILFFYFAHRVTPPVITGEHAQSGIYLLYFINVIFIPLTYPMDFKLQLGDKLTHPQELTFRK